MLQPGDLIDIMVSRPNEVVVKVPSISGLRLRRLRKVEQAGLELGL
jgi:hypothetical protein